MWLIVEGPDGSGKSTLVKEIMRQLTGNGRNCVFTHMGPPASPEAAVAECVEGFYGQYDGQSFDLVSDRWAWGELVYGPIYRPDHNVNGRGSFGEAGWRYTQMFGEARGAYVVLLCPPADILRRRCEVRGEDYIDLADLEDLRDAYLHVWDDAPSTRGKIITSALSFDMLAAVAGTIISEARARPPAPLLERWPSYVGPVTPTTTVATRGELAEQLKVVGGLPQDAWCETGLLVGGRGSF